MANFPSLSKTPIFPLDETSDDAVIRSQSEAGYESTRPRFTRVRKKFTVKYKSLSGTDKTAMDTFYETTCNSGSSIFNWTHPETSIVYPMRFKGPLKWSLVFINRYDLEFELGSP